MSFEDSSSDSENEYCIDYQTEKTVFVESPGQQSETTKALEAAKKIKAIARPIVAIVESNIANVTTQQELYEQSTTWDLFLSTDLPTTIYLQHLVTIYNAQPIATITTMITALKQQQQPPQGESPKQQNAKDEEKKKDEKKVPHVYTIYKLPDHPIAIGLTPLDIPVKHANFLAEAIFKTIQPKQCHFLHSLLLAKVKALLNQDDDITYPLTYCVNNVGNIGDAAAFPQVLQDTKTTTEQLTPLPPHLPLSGFPASLLTYCTLLQIPIIGTISILNIDYITELWLSFEKHLKNIYATQLTMYNTIEKPNKLIHNELLKKFKVQYGKMVAEQERVLPHTKQGGVVPKTMFF